ncbi:hypothetical protein [Capnocytophaga canis]|uniref:hypothetical protein n=1 Tax=Capnocytophaga canis TaxID=1848903 RepID=UPI0015629D10|nr:hypothetical protein [Capnocytophaga canis]
MWFWNNIDKISNIANVVIAALTLFLGFYIFVYQRNKDKKDREIQWLKDLIITPKMEYIQKYFDEISTLKEKIKSDNLTEKERDELIKFIKKISSDLRKSFLIFIQNITPDLHKSINDKIDCLTDDLTNVFSNDEHKLSNEKTYEREINRKIQDTYSFVLEQIFKYK